MTLIQSFKREISRGLNPDHFKLKKFHNKISIHIEVGSYVIKTATTKQEVISSLQLRHLIFIEEFLGRSNSTGLDIDRYDAFFDHLVVVDKKTDIIIATYRMLSSLFSDDFYSRSEFDLQGLLLMNGPFLEIGRACVHPDHRKSIVLNLLWRGIAEYLNQSNCEVLMGCGSIKTENPAQAALLTYFFEKNKYLVNANICPPHAAYYLPGFEESLQLVNKNIWTESEEQTAQTLIPPLFNSYLKAGAKVCKTPAWDKEFKCIDYLILLEKNKIDEHFRKRFHILNSAGN